MVISTARVETEEEEEAEIESIVVAFSEAKYQLVASHGGHIVPHKNRFAHLPGLSEEDFCFP